MLVYCVYACRRRIRRHRVQLLTPSNAPRLEGGHESGPNVQCPCSAASWYRWLPMTVIVLFIRAEISSSSLQLPMISVSSSTLLRRQASMTCSLTDAPWEEVGQPRGKVARKYKPDIPRAPGRPPYPYRRGLVCLSGTGPTSMKRHGEVGRGLAG